VYVMGNFLRPYSIVPGASKLMHFSRLMMHIMEPRGSMKSALIFHAPKLNEIPKQAHYSFTKSKLIKPIKRYLHIYVQNGEMNFPVAAIEPNC